jgi:hypothetical protein
MSAISRISKQIVRVALILLLFQFLAPAFLPLVVQEIPADRETAFHPQHNSLVVPLLLKENDEKEHDDVVTSEGMPPLLDLAAHGVNLIASYKNKLTIVSAPESHPQRALLTLFCTFQI